MDVREALESIALIRRRIREPEIGQVYRALPATICSLLALLGGLLQALLVPDPLENLVAYVSIWSAMAFVGLSFTAVSVTSRDGLKSAWAALTPFAPCLLAGVGLTYAMLRYHPQSAMMLPGLWQILFALGVYQACRFLPRDALGVAGFYMFSGLTLLTTGIGDLSPWTMVLPFAFGQLLAAIVLAERRGHHHESI